MLSQFGLHLSHRLKQPCTQNDARNAQTQCTCLHLLINYLHSEKLFHQPSHQFHCCIKLQFPLNMSWNTKWFPLPQWFPRIYSSWYHFIIFFLNRSLIFLCLNYLQITRSKRLFRRFSIMSIDEHEHYTTRGLKQYIYIHRETWYLSIINPTFHILNALFGG